MLKWFYAAVILALALLIASFAYLNAEPVTVNLYLYSVQWPLSVVLALAFSGGIGLSILVYLPRVLRHKRELARQRRAARQSAEELAKLRSVPMQDSN